jgi:hypothetical protein
VLVVVLGELRSQPLACHAGDDVADPAPRVEAAVAEAAFRLAWLEAEEAEGGAEQAGKRVGHTTNRRVVKTTTIASAPHGSAANVNH